MPEIEVLGDLSPVLTYWLYVLYQDGTTKSILTTQPGKIMQGLENVAIAYCEEES